MAEYGIWCEVWGGVTGHRESWAKKEGQVWRFPTMQAAQSAADDMQSKNMGSPHRTANFSYTVKELN